MERWTYKYAGLPPGILSKMSNDRSRQIPEVLIEGDTLLKRYFASIKQYSWILLACTVIAAGAGFILSKSQPVTFQVSSLMYVNVGAPGTTFTANGTSTASAADSLTTTSNYSTEILTRSVMNTVYHTLPTFVRHVYP